MGHTKKIFKKGIFDSLLTTFEATMIFWGCWVSIKKVGPNLKQNRQSKVWPS